MQRRLREVLNNQGENYILPFYWQHGESKELLLEGMEKIYECGIKAVCLEARPHPDFAGNLWWRDLDIILEKAKELNMKVWVLDDAHFPTGRCNNKVTPDSPHRKFVLVYYGIDAKGPMKESSFIVDLKENETFIGAVAARKSKVKDYAYTEVIDISKCYNGDVIEWDIPSGYWNVIVFKTTDKNSGRPGYANVIDKDAVRFFLDTVYEPHYEHYKNEFGNVFAGFFSDEPEIGNTFREVPNEDSRAGVPGVPLPWCGELEEKLRELWGENFCVYLTALWNEIDVDTDKSYQTGKVRKEYSDLVTVLYQKNFCEQVGDWCRTHGVEYIGHVIEEARFGVGAGHYFRSLWGQDMSGIDVVLQQTRPELDDMNFYKVKGTTLINGVFFHYALAKLGSSLAHIDEKKKGRAMCEIFGAYGWTEGVKLMKWLVDHMLVRGINYYVPHGFTMKNFPDPDCPPHFYARGNNPQFSCFKLLMKYLNRVSHLINGGVHKADVGILYSQDLEWIQYGVMDHSEVAKELTQNQIDFDIVPVDVVMEGVMEHGELLSGAKVYDKDVLVGQEKIKTLVIPQCHYVEKRFADWCEKAIKENIHIICVNELPKIINENGIITEWGAYVPETIKIGNLCEVLRERNIGLDIDKTDKYLRFYHYSHIDGEYYLFFNESVSYEIKADIKLQVQPDKQVIEYNAWENRLEEAEWSAHSGILHLELLPYQMKIVAVGNRVEEHIVEKRKGQLVREESNLNWKLYLKTPKETEFTFYKELTTFINVTKGSEKPEFCGTMKYVAEFTVDSERTPKMIDFGEVFETVELRINGKLVGTQITPPYVFDIEEFLLEGKNILELEVTNTVVHQVRDWLSVTMPMEPSGVLGPVCFFY